MKIIMVLKRVMFFQVFQRFKLVVPGFYWCLAEFQDGSRNKVDINWSYLSRGNEVLNHGSEFMVPHVQTIPLKIKHDTNMTHVFFQTPHVFKSMVPCIYLILTMNIPHLSFIFIISPWYFSHRSDPFILILPTPASRSLIRIAKRRGGSSPAYCPAGCAAMRAVYHVGSENRETPKSHGLKHLNVRLKQKEITWGIPKTKTISLKQHPEVLLSTWQNRCIWKWVGYLKIANLPSGNLT